LDLNDGNHVLQTKQKAETDPIKAEIDRCFELEKIAMGFGIN
jgi:hypothetical protein